MGTLDSARVGEVVGSSPSHQAGHALSVQPDTTRPGLVEVERAGLCGLDSGKSSLQGQAPVQPNGEFIVYSNDMYGVGFDEILV